MNDKNQRIRDAVRKTLEKRKSQVCRVFECKVQANKLNTLQKEQLKMLFIEGKWFYNHVLNWSKQEGNSIFDCDTSKIKTVMHYDKDKKLIKSPLGYLGSSVKSAIVQTMQANIKAISSLRKKGYQKHTQGLKFKDKLTSLCFRQLGITHKIVSKNKVKLQGVKRPFYVNGLEQFINDHNIEIANLHLVNRPDGYFLKITTFTNKHLIQNPSQNTTIALDFGCETSFTTSNGDKINVKIKEPERLKRLQKSLSRKQKHSNNYYKCQNTLAKEYQKLSNKKNDIANKLVSKLKNGYSTIIIQDEQLANWHKTNHGKSIQHSVLGRVKTKLKQCKNVVILDKFIPTTKFCCNCGNICETIPQYIRTFTCDCGIELDRDVHAAKNMVWIYEHTKNLVPTGHREITRTEFLTAVDICFANKDKSKTKKHEAAKSLASR